MVNHLLLICNLSQLLTFLSLEYVPVEGDWHKERVTEYEYVDIFCIHM
jgi:hypothetical protein